MSRLWRWFLLGYVLALPHTLVGFVLAAVYRCHSFAWRDGVLEATAAGTIIGRPGAQTHGWLVIYADATQRARRDLRVHENCHVVQGFLGGPLYVLAYGLTFAWFYVVGGFGDWRAAYHRIPFERQAYARQAAYVAAPSARTWGHR